MIDTNALPGTMNVIISAEGTVATLIDLYTGYTTVVDLTLRVAVSSPASGSPGSMIVDQIALARLSRLTAWCCSCNWSKVVVSFIFFSPQIDCFVCLPAERSFESGRPAVPGRGIPDRRENMPRKPGMEGRERATVVRTERSNKLGFHSAAYGGSDSQKELSG